MATSHDRTRSFPASSLLGFVAGLSISMAVAAVAAPNKAATSFDPEDAAPVRVEDLEPSALACSAFQALGVPLDGLGSLSLLQERVESDQAPLDEVDEFDEVEITALKIEREGRAPELARLRPAEGGGFIAGRLFVEIHQSDGRSYASITSLDEPLVHASCGLEPAS